MISDIQKVLSYKKSSTFTLRTLKPGHIEESFFKKAQLDNNSTWLHLSSETWREGKDIAGNTFAIG